MPTKPTDPYRLAPKESFLADAATREAHNNYAGSQTAQAALTTALAEMVARQVAGDPVARAHNASKLEGAREFVAIWLNVGRPVYLPPEREIPALKPV